MPVGREPGTEAETEQEIKLWVPTLLFTLAAFALWLQTFRELSLAMN